MSSWQPTADARCCVTRMHPPALEEACCCITRMHPPAPEDACCCAPEMHSPPALGKESGLAHPRPHAPLQPAWLREACNLPACLPARVCLPVSACPSLPVPALAVDTAQPLPLPLLVHKCAGPPAAQHASKQAQSSCTQVLQSMNDTRTVVLKE